LFFSGALQWTSFGKQAAVSYILEGDFGRDIYFLSIAIKSV